MIVEPEQCPHCHKFYASALPRVNCPHCGGQLIKLPRGLRYAQRQQKISERARQQERIIDWISSLRVPGERGLGDTLERLIDVGTRRNKAGFVQALRNLASLSSCNRNNRKRYWNAECPYQMPKIDITFVTSLSPLPQHEKSQHRALTSWGRIGASVIAVNTHREISKLQDKYPQVNEWRANDKEAAWNGRSTQPIKALADVALSKGPVLLINSDIEVVGDQRILLDTLPDDRLVLGVRWNYEHHIFEAHEFQWGFDVIGITPEHAKKLPADFPFGIGQPVWDYAAPLMMSDKFRVIHEPLFYHKNHPLNWSPESWQEGADHFERLIGKPINYGLTAQWRQQFEPDMVYEGDRYVRRTDR